MIDFTKFLPPGASDQISGMMGSMKAAVATIEVTGESGAGSVKVQMNGLGEIFATEIDPDLCTPENREILQDFLVGAYNDAKRKLEPLVQEKQQDLILKSMGPLASMFPFKQK